MIERLRARLKPEIMVPLFAAYFAFAAYYVWQAWRRETPAIFTDELEFTQISRAIAHTGSPARREEAFHFTSLTRTSPRRRGGCTGRSRRSTRSSTRACLR